MLANQKWPENFNLLDGGLFHPILVKLSLNEKRWKLAIVMLCVTWLPLAILSAIDGNLFSSSRFSFVKDYAIHARLLLAMPVLILIPHAIYRVISPALQYATEVLVGKEDREYFLAGILQKVKIRTASFWVEIIFLLVVIVAAASPAKEAIHFEGYGEPGSWFANVENGNHVLSYAGKWAVYFSIPVVRFLLLRWMWRYFVWIVFLYRCSRLSLNLQPTHPDGTGGLGIIGLAQRRFVLFFAAWGIILAGEMLVRLDGSGNSFESIKTEMFGFIVLCLFIILLPLFFFTPALISTKQQGLFNLSNLGTKLSYMFEEGWINKMKTEKKTADDSLNPSTLFDYFGVYSYLQKLRIVPLSLTDVITLSLILFLPFIPIFFIHFSIGELLQKVLGLLL